MTYILHVTSYDNTFIFKLYDKDCLEKISRTTSVFEDSDRYKNKKSWFFTGGNGIKFIAYLRELNKFLKQKNLKIEYTLYSCRSMEEGIIYQVKEDICDCKKD
jgi:hypothetical protein